MSFSATFGSFGDFVSVVIIIKDLYSALSESSGSPREYQSLKDELDDVADLVQKLATLTANLDPEHARSIERQIERWTVTMRLHEKRIRDYPALAQVPLPALNKRQRIWRAIQKIKWRLVNSKNVSKIQSDINSFRSSFSSHLNAANLALVLAPQKPPGFNGSNCVNFVDALGQHFSLFLWQCSDWKKLHYQLVGKFSDRAGESYVIRGAYSFLWNEGENVVDEKQWSKIAKEGMLFEMAVILTKQGESSATNSEKCPRCRKRNNPHSSDAKGWITCSYCNGQYQVTSVLELHRDQLSEHTGDGCRSMDHAKIDDGGHDEENELSLIKMFLLERQQSPLQYFKEFVRTERKRLDSRKIELLRQKQAAVYADLRTPTWAVTRKGTRRASTSDA